MTYHLTLTVRRKNRERELVKVMYVCIAPIRHTGECYISHTKMN